MKIGCEDFGWGVEKGREVSQIASGWLSLSPKTVALTEESTQENGLQSGARFVEESNVRVNHMKLPFRRPESLKYWQFQMIQQ